MEDLGKKIQSARLKKGLSIQEVSDKTKIRPHVITAIENNDFSVMPNVYIKSFIKTLYSFLGIKEEITSEKLEMGKENAKQADDSFAINPIKTNKTDSLDIPKEPKISVPKVESIDDTKSTPKDIEKTHPLKEEFRKKDAKKSEKQKINTKKKPAKVISFETENTQESVYTEIFKRNNIEKSFRPNVIKIILISFVALVILAAIYFLFLDDLIFHKEKNNEISQTAEDSAVVISADNKDLFSTFIPQSSDSVVLRAKAIDTAWLNIEIDGKTNEQTLMKPGMERRWSAKEYFVITQGNAGSIEYTRNNQLLQPFGAKGTVVRNIKITMTEVLNATESAQDSLRKASNSYNKAQKKKQKREIPRIEPSNIDIGN